MGIEISLNQTTSDSGVACRQNEDKSSALANPWVDAAIAAGVVVGAALLLKSRALPEVAVEAGWLPRPFSLGPRAAQMAESARWSAEDAATRNAIREAHSGIDSFFRPEYLKALNAAKNEKMDEALGAATRVYRTRSEAIAARTLEERLAAVRPTEATAGKIVTPPQAPETETKFQQPPPISPVVKNFGIIPGKIVKPREQTMEDLFRGLRQSQ